MKKPTDVTPAGWQALQRLHATGGPFVGGRGAWNVVGRLVECGYLAYKQVGPIAFRYVLTEKALKALGVQPPAPQPGTAADPQPPTESEPCSTG